MTRMVHTLPEQLYVNYSKVKKKGNFLKSLSHMCSISVIPCELTSQKLLGKKKVHGAPNLALILLFIISNETGKQSPTEISHCSCFNPPPFWFPEQLRLKIDLSPVWDVVPGWGAVGRSRQHKAFCLPGLCWATNPHPRDSARLLSAAGKMLLVSHLKNETTHSTGQGAKIIMG